MNLIPSADNDLAVFLNYLYDGSDGYVYSPTKSIEGVFTQHFFEWPGEGKELYNHIAKSTSDIEVYVAPAIFSAPDATKANFKSTKTVWTEFDGELPGDLNIPRPTLRIRSSSDTHEHWYWALSEPEYDANVVETINRSITYSLGADSSSWDINQVLRPPQTMNHKRHKITKLLELTSTLIDTSEFDEIRNSAPVVLPVVQDGVVPDIMDVILKYPFPMEFQILFRSNPEAPSEANGFQGLRSKALMNLAYSCAEVGLTDVEIYSVLRNADDRWGKFKDRTDRPRRLTDIIAHARIKHPTVLQVNDDNLEAFGWTDLLNSDIHIEWAIKGLLAKKGYMLWTGKSGVGKTQVSLRMAMNLVLGTAWLGFKVERKFKILFLSLEMAHEEIKEFIIEMSNGLTDEQHKELNENLIIIPRGEPLAFDKPAGQAIVNDLLDRYKPDGLMVDSAGSAISGDISAEGPVKAAMEYNDQIRQKYGCFTWWIHHQRKGQAENKKPTKLEDVYGNQYIYNRATSVVVLWPGKDLIEVTELKKRLAALAPTYNIRRLPNLDFIRMSNTIFKDDHTSVVYNAPQEPTKPISNTPTGELGGDLSGL